MSQHTPRTVVITGGTSWIGRGIALHLARAHSQLVLNYATNDEKAQETLHLCQQETAQVILVKADVSKKPEVERLMRTCIERFHTLDVLINNAARVRDKPVLEMTEEDWDEVVDTNNPRDAQRGREVRGSGTQWGISRFTLMNWSSLKPDLTHPGEREKLIGASGSLEAGRYHAGEAKLVQCGFVLPGTALLLE